MTEEGERVVIPAPDRESAIFFLEGQKFLGRIIAFCVLKRDGPIWLIHARIIQGPFWLNKLYTFDEFEPL